MNKTFTRALLVAALASPLAAANPTTSPTPSPTRARIARPHNDLLSALRALSAAKRFLAKAANDPSGHRSKAQEALETALTEVNADVKESGLSQ
jgi:hypothetical protein